MALDTGARLGPFEIIGTLGAGGMGEVYRARDTRLDRAVAIKVLPASLAGDPQLRERFDREARAISSLNHPHICTLHDVGHQDGVDFLVLECLEGESLDARLKARAPSGLPIAEALRVAIEIASALDAAHRAGIVHRDLKPANVMLTKSGAKLLDFGLAKSAAPVIATSGLSMAPTTPPNLTAQGTILGTFQYMAPEQIEGAEADARTDIFAFGAVLFEMLTGRPAFEGKTRAQLLGAILKDEPPPVSHVTERSAEVPRSGPPALDRIVSTCLSKDPDDRWQTARDLLRELKWVAEKGPAETGRDGPGDLGTRDRSRRPPLGGPAIATLAGLLAIALAAASTIAVRHLRETPPAQDAMRFTIAAPEKTTFGGPPGGGTGPAAQIAISPDGRHIAFVARAQSRFTLWVRSIESLTARNLPGTEDAAFPFWSADSRFIGFFAAGKLKKVQLTGGPPIVVCDAAAGRGGSWNRDNVIVFSPDTTSGLQRVSGGGGVPVPASVLDADNGETSHRWPHFLPDGRHFLYTGTTGTCCPPSKPGRIKIGALDTKDTSVVLAADSSSAYASGELLFNREGTLMSQPFDAAKRVTTGDPFPVAESLDSEGSRYASLSVSATGVLVYAPSAAASGSNHLVWFDRTGRTIGELGEPAAYRDFSLSPDERHVATTIASGSPPNLDIWTIDIARGVTSRLTFDRANEVDPIWSPDSSRIAFHSLRSPDPGIHQKAAAGTGDEEVLLTGERGSTFLPNSWSADGKLIAYDMSPASGTSRDIWILPMSGERPETRLGRPPAETRKPFPSVQGPSSDLQAAFSPDARWIAYVSDESGVSQVYVQPVPATGGRHQVTRNGGEQPLWRGDGKELFYLAPDGTVMSTAVDTTAGFQAGLPQPLFQSRAAAQSARQQYAVTKDGKRFLMLLQQGADQSGTSKPLTVLVNWLAAVQK